MNFRYDVKGVPLLNAFMSGDRFLFANVHSSIGSGIGHDY
jgi:hypothetical protein